jgi:preprotein translocase subunit SecE
MFHVDALVATHVCFVMVFIFCVDMTFSWMVSTPA